MTQSKIEWMQAKAEQMLHNQVEQIGKSEYPASDLADGILEAFYALGLITDFGYGYWQCQIKLSVCDRRDDLREAKLRALFDAPVLAGGELINGGGL